MSENKLKKAYLINRKNPCCDYTVSVYSNKEYAKKILEALKKKYINEDYLLDEDFYDNDISKGLRVYKELEYYYNGEFQEDYEEFTIQEFNILPKGYYNTSLGIEEYL